MMTAKSSSLASAMASAFAEFEAATKDATNPHFRSKYAGLPSVIDAVKPALIANRLFFTQSTHEAEGGVCVETHVHHESGERLGFGKLFVPANKQDAQAYGSALTYARRYSLMTAFGIPAEDDDGHAAASSANHGPAPRTKLDGPHTSKTALKQAIDAMRGEVGAAKWVEDINAVLKAGKDTIAQAERDWPALLNGFPDIAEDEGLKGLVARRREELSDDGTVSMLIRSMKETDTVVALDNWYAANEAVIEVLDGPESRRLMLAYDLHKSGIEAMDISSA